VVDKVGKRTKPVQLFYIVATTPLFLLCLALIMGLSFGFLQHRSRYLNLVCSKFLFIYDRGKKQFVNFTAKA
jgi:hypothetical protein